MRDVVEKAVIAFSDEEVELQSGAVIEPGDQLSQIDLKEDELAYVLRSPAAGAYVLFTEHHPDEFEAFVQDAQGNRVEASLTREYKPDHEHDEEVTSVAINTPGDLDLKEFNDWLQELLSKQGQDIFRMKGFLSIADNPRRFVFQGVHMLFDSQPDKEWGDDPRRNQLVFIGRNLDEEGIRAGFNACLR